ncbi:uncharacterized protein B0H18DRAFT_1018437 [Fomitopsis serialis]|uniref:uncharacterized protein n=1 Tax=Fomitopsis serialis TaxID=139415 RepID=UPI0020077869|nr:uncharacterized protein B0H18DRAFT_1018437 [Neoantrodia serialis]KAH9922192.1 hypothetical protein B0H18DRAFT_1018437 [Neoantrodia serialis]
MSSDESDHAAGRGEPTYFIRKKSWRSPALVAWLRTLDALHLFLRYKGAHLASQGGWPHYRLESDIESSKPAVTGLPIGFYSAAATMDQFEAAWLKPLVISVNLIHSDRVLTHAARYDLSNRHIVTGRFDPRGEPQPASSRQRGSAQQSEMAAGRST